MKTEPNLTDKIRLHFPDMSKARAKQTAEILSLMRQLEPDVREHASRFLGRLADNDPVAGNLLHEFKTGNITAEEFVQRGRSHEN